MARKKKQEINWEPQIEWWQILMAVTMILIIIIAFAWFVFINERDVSEDIKWDVVTENCETEYKCEFDYEECVIDVKDRYMNIKGTCKLNENVSYNQDGSVNVDQNFINNFCEKRNVCNFEDTSDTVTIQVPNDEFFDECCVTVLSQEFFDGNRTSYKTGCFEANNPDTQMKGVNYNGKWIDVGKCARMSKTVDKEVDEKEIDIQWLLLNAQCEVGRFENFHVRDCVSHSSSIIPALVANKSLTYREAMDLYVDVSECYYYCSVWRADDKLIIRG